MSNKLQINMLRRKTTASTKEYKNAKRNTKQICRRRKRQFEENLLHELEDKFGPYESRECTEGISKFKMGFQPRPNLYEDSNENLVAGEQQVLHVWAEYFKGLLKKGRGESSEYCIFWYWPFHTHTHYLHGLGY